MSSVKPTQMQPQTLTGGCQCQRLRYNVTLPDPDTQLHKDFFYCHCSTCRRLSGGAFLPFIGVPVECFIWTAVGATDPEQHDGSNAWQEVPFRELPRAPASSLGTLNVAGVANRTFCNACGSPLTMDYLHWEQDVVWITMGSMDDGWLARMEAGRGSQGPGLVSERGVLNYHQDMQKWGDVSVLAGCPRLRQGPEGYPHDD